MVLTLLPPSSYHIDINKDIQVETTTGARATFAVPIDVNSFEVINYKAREHVDQIVSFPDLTRVLTIKWTDNEGFEPGAPPELEYVAGEGVDYYTRSI